MYSTSLSRDYQEALGGDERAVWRNLGRDERAVWRNLGGDERAVWRNLGGDERAVWRNLGGDERAVWRNLGGDERAVWRNLGGDERAVWRKFSSNFFIDPWEWRNNRNDLRGGKFKYLCERKTKGESEIFTSSSPKPSNLQH